MQVSSFSAHTERTLNTVAYLAESANAHGEAPCLAPCFNMFHHCVWPHCTTRLLSILKHRLHWRLWPISTSSPLQIMITYLLKPAPRLCLWLVPVYFVSLLFLSLLEITLTFTLCLLIHKAFGLITEINWRETITGLMLFHCSDAPSLLG